MVVRVSGRCYMLQVVCYEFEVVVPKTYYITLLTLVAAVSAGGTVLIAVGFDPYVSGVRIKGLFFATLFLTLWSILSLLQIGSGNAGESDEQVFRRYLRRSFWTTSIIVGLLAIKPIMGAIR